MGDLEVLFDGRDVQVTAYRRPTSTVMISFSWTRTDAGRRLGDRFIARHPEFSGIFFVAKGVNVAQAPDIAEALVAARRAAADYDRRIVVGASFGGYGALLFGAALAPEMVVAVSPLTTVSDPDVIRMKKKQILPPYLDDVPAALGGLVPTLIYDPLSPIDSPHADWLAARHPVREIHTPLAGHTPLRLLKRAGLLEAGLRCFLTGCDPAEFTRLYEKAVAAQTPFAEAAPAAQ